MPYGFTCKEVAAALNVGETKATAIMQPLMLKMARLLLHDSEKAMKGLVQAMEEIRRAAEAAEREADEREIDIRIRMGTGRLNRDVVHPNRSG